ncbi:hypothetical protein ASH00_14475 [Arthrobacter sp. Soil782]|uniref:hypothetical protein n=1 Tax=Arthrobacter sp. Soil782 TaxID=1736410 RepID=UPI0006F4474E|nr:hypothetical protein [Arthrobacter sp. Soil782]KRF04307.1 hypothetical protein ASH00_14475 [Arthrobacter sp. Soil782]
MTPVRSARKSIIGVSAASLAVVAGLWLWASAEGPMRSGGDPSELCTPAPDQGFAAIGDVVANDGARPLTITGVELVDPVGLTIEDSYGMVIDEVSDRDSQAVLGSTTTEYDHPLHVAAWERRTKLGELDLGPGESANIVLTLSLPGDTDGSAQAMRVSYTDGFRTFTADTSMRLVLTHKEACF